MARFRRETGGDGAGDSWQITYCSVVMILVAIFMMIISYSTIEGKKMSRAMSGMGEKKERAAQGPQKAGTGNPTEDLIESTMAALKKEMGNQRLGDGHAIARTRAGIKWTVSGGFFFSSEAAKLREEAYPALNLIASVVKDTPFHLGVAVHSDVPSSGGGNARSSWETTALRAGLIVKHLSEEGGLPLRRLAAAGFGPYRPALTGGEPRGTGKNERVEFLIELPAQPVQNS